MNLSKFTASLLTALAVSCAAFTASATTIVIEIEAMIDGRDLLIINDNTLQWDHLSFAAVGRHAGLDAPTVITTSLDGVTVLDRYEWIPGWSAAAPDPIKSPEMSSVFLGLTPVLPDGPMSVTLEVLQARESLTLFEGPGAANDYSVILDFNDFVTDSHATYMARVILEYDDNVALAEPAGAAIFAIGAGWLAWRRRRATTA